VGLASLSAFALDVFANSGILGRLIVRGAAADTVRNTASHEQHFRPDYLREFGAERLQAFVSASMGTGLEKHDAGLLFHAVDRRSSAPSCSNHASFRRRWQPPAFSQTPGARRGSSSRV
jgi:hypothetical protein